MSFVGRRKVYTDVKCEKFGNPCSFWIHVALNTLFDCQGHGSYFVTRRLINRLREEKPDIIHLHNLHGYYLNLPLLFRYINREYQGKVFWTFHDCWPFTGHCPHFTMAGCGQWKTGGVRCPQKKSYPISLMMDRAKKIIWKSGICFRGSKILRSSHPPSGCGIVLDENRIEGYRKAIERIGADEPDRRKIAEHGSRDGRQSMTDKILELYEGLQ